MSSRFSSDQGAKVQEYFVYFKLLQRRARRKSAGRRRSGINQRFPKETGKKCGSSRKDVGFKPGNRQGEIANQGKNVTGLP